MLLRHESVASLAASKLAIEQEKLFVGKDAGENRKSWKVVKLSESTKISVSKD
jgi:hypothetical protein